VYSFSNKSKQILLECDGRLQTIFLDVIGVIDCQPLEGHRSRERQQELYDSGASKIQSSKHNYLPSRAIDISPYPIPDGWGEDHPKEMAKFYYFAGIVKGVASKHGIRIRWGGDWDGDNDFKDQTFDDLVHFELYP